MTEGDGLLNKIGSGLFSPKDRSDMTSNVISDEVSNASAADKQD